jgi:homogentisate 1,2-dioxygenase
VAIIQRFGAALNLNVHALVLDGVYAEDGFHAAVVVPGRDRARLERVCRYALRPPVAHDRIRLTEQGQVRLELRHRWADGTSHLLFAPIELLERLAALTPRRRTCCGRS